MALFTLTFPVSPRREATIRSARRPADVLSRYATAKMPRDLAEDGMVELVNFLLLFPKVSTVKS